VAVGLADGVLDHARGSPPLASALASIYGAEAPGRTASIVESALGAAD
jgi:hypothetical protein